MSNNPYIQPSGPPKLLKSFVCYADILGYGLLSKTALSAGQGEKFLVRLRRALSNTYERVRLHATGFRDKSKLYYAIKVFTDNIVVGYPVHNFDFDLGEPELGDILMIFAEFQATLALEGFFIRGGIAYGDHYMDDDIVYGEALLEAVALDKHGGPPRLELAPSTIEIVRKQLDFYGEVKDSPHDESLLEDADGTIFLNYLDEAFSALPDGGIFFDLIDGHRQNIINGLREYKGFPGIRSKYDWAARYHNFVCQDFTTLFPLITDPNASKWSITMGEEAQKLLNFLIDVESLAASPTHLSIKPIRLRRT
jgi:hypothetical protein